ncbi:MAG: Ig-like domain-containing protein [Planctomycetota bacterium]
MKVWLSLSAIAIFLAAGLAVVWLAGPESVDQRPLLDSVVEPGQVDRSNDPDVLPRLSKEAPPSDAITQSMPDELIDSVARADLQVQVRDDRGASVPDAWVAWRSASGPGRYGRTDAAGSITLSLPVDEVGRLTVVARDRRPFQDRVLGGTRRFDVTLVSGHRVSGQVLVLGRPPERTLRLSLASKHPLLKGVLDEGFSRELEQASMGQNVTTTESDLQGRFSFPADLPGDWTGLLRIDDGWQIEAASEGEADHGELQLSAPAEDLLIRLKHRPCLVGRLVSAKGKGQADLRVEVELGARRLAYSDRDGWFRFLCDPGGTGELTLRVLAGELEIAKKTVLANEIATRTDWTGECDLGEIEIPAVRPVRVWAEDASGNPLPEAWAKWRDDRDERAQRADGRGLVEVGPLPFAIESLTVGARTFTEQTITVTPDRHDYSVRLKIGDYLEVDLRTASGAPAYGVSVWLEQAGARVRLDDVETDEKHDGFGFPPAEVPGRASRFGTSAFDPAEPFTLEVVSKGGQSVVERKSFPAAADETPRHVVFGLSRDPTRLEVTVESSLPIQSRVELKSAGSGRRLEVIQMISGSEKTFDDLWEIDVIVSVQVGERSTERRLRLYPGRQRETIVVDPGRVLKVELENLPPQFVPTAHLSKGIENHLPIVPSSPSRDVFQFAGLDSAEYELVVRCEGWSTSRRVKPGEDHLVIELPDPVALELVWDDPMVRDRVVNAQLDPEWGRALGSVFFDLATFDRSGTVKLPSVLPGRYVVRLLVDRAVRDDLQQTITVSGDEDPCVIHLTKH